MHRQEGFTLIELMIVILIIGILVGIAVPVFLSAQASAQKRTCESNRRTVISAADVYASNPPVATPAIPVGTYPTDVGALNPDYLNKLYLPATGGVNACPSGGTIAWGLTANAPPDPVCSGVGGDAGAHGAIGAP
jgi:prepilin-type N-terminal cleavage/methylation domain-containing protein